MTSHSAAVEKVGATRNSVRDSSMYERVAAVIADVFGMKYWTIRNSDIDRILDEAEKKHERPSC